MSEKVRDFREAPRPNHPDAMDASELKRIEFTGIRRRVIDNSTECWLMGELKFFVSETALKLDPDSFNKKYAELFALHDVEQTPMKRN